MQFDCYSVTVNLFKAGNRKKVNKVIIIRYSCYVQYNKLYSLQMVSH